VGIVRLYGNFGASTPSIAAPIPPHRVGGWGISEV
jgi:hypothetical protein